jgi:hypothetical protein
MWPFVERALVLSSVLLLFGVTAAGAAVCNVPSGSYPTIQEAVDDLTCTQVVIAAGTFVEAVEVDRTLEITGASSTATVVEGRIAVSGAGVELILGSLKVDASAPSVAGCFPEAVDVSGGTEVTGNDLVAINGDGSACLIFGDGFEIGNTGAWATTVP